MTINAPHVYPTHISKKDRTLRKKREAKFAIQRVIAKDNRNH